MGATHFDELVVANGVTVGGAFTVSGFSLQSDVTSGTTLTQTMLVPGASSTVTSINYHKLFGIGEITGTTAYGFGAPTKPTTGVMASFGRTAIATATLTDTSLDVRAINKLVNTGANTLQGAYIKAKNYSTGTVGGDLIGLFIETVQDGTCSGSSYGLKIGCDGSTITSDMLLRNGTTINNSDANTLTITEANIVLAGAVNSTGVLQLGATATAALAMGGGTSSTKLTTSTADKNFLGFWTQSTATSGDSRCAYLRHYLGGTIASSGYGDTVRAFTTVTGTGYSSATGTHSTCQINASASVTGLAAGLRSSLAFASTVAQGQLYALMADIQSDATNANVANASAFLLCRNSGTGTKTGYLAKIGDDEGAVTTGSGDTTVHKTGNTFTCTGGLRCTINGADVWIPVGTISTT